MKIIEIAVQSNGAHRNQEGVFVTIPEGWAVIPSTMDVPETFPFVDIEVEGNVVVSMTAGTVPEPEPVAPAQEREQAYNTENVIEWDGEMLTVTEASLKWQYYAAEGSPRADELQALIASAKADIRAQYPDSEGV